MLANNGQRLKIWLDMREKFDYEEFYEKCVSEKCLPLPPLEFAQKAGMVSCAMVMRPDLPPADAYVRFAESKGLGDTIAKITHATGLSKLAEAYTRITGKPCGCTSRQEALNKLIPYGVKEER